MKFAGPDQETKIELIKIALIKIKLLIKIETKIRNANPVVIDITNTATLNPHRSTGGGSRLSDEKSDISLLKMIRTLLSLQFKGKVPQHYLNKRSQKKGKTM